MDNVLKKLKALETKYFFIARNTKSARSKAWATLKKETFREAIEAFVNGGGDDAPTHLEQFTQIFEGAGLVTVTEPIEHNGETKGITLFAYRKDDRENPINLLHFKTDGGLAT